MKQERVLGVPVPVRLFALSAIALQLTGCELAKGIFTAGFWIGILVVVAVLGLAGLAVAKMRG